MLNQLLAEFYERDLNNLIQEIALFKNEINLWRVAGEVKNSAGNLALHIIGGTNYLIGTQLANTGYQRNREREFTDTGILRHSIIEGLGKLNAMLKEVLSIIDLNETYPIKFDNKQVANSYLLIQLLAHLNYHLGQINYLRRILEKD